jgi:hypothetical protein
VFRQIDRSAWLTDLIKRLSTGLSRRRGLPLIVAIVVIILSLILHLLALAFPGSGLMLACAFTVLHVGLLIGFIGIVLMEPLGRG